MPSPIRTQKCELSCRGLAEDPGPSELHHCGSKKFNARYLYSNCSSLPGSGKAVVCQVSNQDLRGTYVTFWPTHIRPINLTALGIRVRKPTEANTEMKRWDFPIALYMLWFLE